MAQLIPFFFESGDRPSRVLDQHFGLGLTAEDLLEPITLSEHRPRYCLREPSMSGMYYRPWRSALSKADDGSTVRVSKDAFHVSLDVQQFAPEELKVSVEGKMVKIEGKHEEKADDHGFISRHFVRKYAIPEGTDIDKVYPTLSSDGVLSITAPRVNQEDTSRSIPITKTGAPSRVMQKKKGQEVTKNGEK